MNFRLPKVDGITLTPKSHGVVITLPSFRDTVRRAQVNSIAFLHPFAHKDISAERLYEGLVELLSDQTWHAGRPLPSDLALWICYAQKEVAEYVAAFLREVDRLTCTVESEKYIRAGRAIAHWHSVSEAHDRKYIRRGLLADTELSMRGLDDYFSNLIDYRDIECPDTDIRAEVDHLKKKNRAYYTKHQHRMVALIEACSDTAQSANVAPDWAETIG